MELLRSIPIKSKHFSLKEAADHLEISQELARLYLGKPDITTDSRMCFYLKSRVEKYKYFIKEKKIPNPVIRFGSGKSRSGSTICEKCGKVFPERPNPSVRICKWCAQNMKRADDEYNVMIVHKLGTRICPICKENRCFVGQKVCESCGKLKTYDRTNKYNEDFIVY